MIADTLLAIALSTIAPVHAASIDTAREINWIDIRQEVIDRSNAADEMTGYDLYMEQRYIREKHFAHRVRPTYWFYSCVWYGTDWC